MIEFNGTITGRAEKFLWKKSRKLGLGILAVSFSLIFIPVLIICINTDYWDLMIGFSALCASTFLLTFIPKTKKEKEKLLPNKIFTDVEYIVCQTKIGLEEFKLISDASKLIDYGDFYFISFPVGNLSDSFVCQKNLLTNGTLEEFEALFEGKIERKTNENHKNK